MIVLKLLGESEQAQDVIDHMVEESRLREARGIGDFRLQTSLGWAYALSGNTAKAKTAIDSALAIRSEDADAVYGSNIAIERAAILSWIGDKNEAIKELIRLSQKPSNLNVHILKSSLDFYPLRDHPGFQALLEDPALKAPLPIKNQYP